MSLADDANLLLIPTGYKAQKLYSIFPTSGVGDFDFARTTSATRVAKNGFITTVGTNVPRLNYDILDGEVVGCPHLLLEDEAINLIQYSENFSQSYWTKEKTSITSNVVISPDGTLNASKLVEDSSNGLHRTYSNLITTSQNNNYTSTVFAKKGGRDIFGIQTSSSAQPFVWFNLDRGIIELQQSGIVGKIESLPNGWYKCSATWNSSSATNDRVFIQLAQSISNTSYTGDGTSGVYIWGAMFEKSSFPTSYIKSNSGSPTTRAAETCNGSGNAATFNDSEGVLMLEASSDATTSVIWSVSDGSNSNAVSLYYGGQGVLCDIFSSAGTRTLIATMPIGLRSNMNKFLIKYKSTDSAIWLNGFELAVNAQTISLSGLNELEGAYGSGSFPFYGKVKQIQYHSTVLSDSNLEKLSSWTSFEDMAQSQLYTIQ